MNEEIVGEDYLDFKCPHCGALNSFPTSAARLLRQCLNCLDLLLVPAKDGEPGRKLPLPMETYSIRLRPFQAPDWKDLLEYQFKDEDEATGWIHSLTRPAHHENFRELILAVENRHAPKVIATLTIRFTDNSFEQAELTTEENKSVGQSELPRNTYEAALQFCFRELNLHRVIICCETTETAARQLYNQLGLRQEAELLKRRRVGREWVSDVWFAMLEEEYFRKQSAARQ